MKQCNAIVWKYIRDTWDSLLSAASHLGICYILHINLFFYYVE